MAGKTPRASDLSGKFWRGGSPGVEGRRLMDEWPDELIHELAVEAVAHGIPATPSGDGQDLPAFAGMAPIPGFTELPEETREMLISHLMEMMRSELRAIDGGDHQFLELESEQRAHAQTDEARLHAEKAAATDALTGLGTLESFRREMRRIFGELEHGRFQWAAVIFVDADDFKQINDVLWNHEGGDFAIRAMAHVLADVCRQEDILARRSGDEFILGVRGNGDPKKLDITLERIRERIADINVGVAFESELEGLYAHDPERLERLHREGFHVKGSAGMFPFDKSILGTIGKQGDALVIELLQRAEKRMKQEKKARKDRGERVGHRD